MVQDMKSLRVLLADDHQILREGLKALLKNQPDIEVVAEAETGQVAISKSHELCPDVIIMDISMRDMDGIVATQHIKAQSPEMRILCLSVHQESHIVSSMLEAGASGYIVKTSAAQELIEAVRTVASGKTYLSPSITQDFVTYHVKGKNHLAESTNKQLTQRERDVLQLIAEGHNTAEIADCLCISPKTVLAHRHRIMAKLEMSTTVALAKYAMRQGIINP
jgi:DNA-binding NarL/FixJ family response regulator